MTDKDSNKKTVTANDAMATRHLEKSLATQHLRNSLNTAPKSDKKEDNSSVKPNNEEGDSK